MGKHLGGTGASLVLRSPRTPGQTLAGGRVVGRASGWQVCPFQLWGTAGDPKALGDQDSVEGGSGLAWEQHRGQCQGFGWDRPKARAPLWNRTRDWPLPPEFHPRPTGRGLPRRDQPNTSLGPVYILGNRALSSGADCSSTRGAWNGKSSPGCPPLHSPPHWPRSPCLNPREGWALTAQDSS